MVRQTKPNYFELQPIPPGASATSLVPAPIRLGPLQRLKLAVRLSLIRTGSRVPVPPKPLWVAKGWRQAAGAKEYTGQYKAAGRTWRGLIQHPYPGGYHAYIWSPPLEELQRNTGHKPCFSPNGEAGRYQIHFHTIPTSVDHAITSIEAVLAEACTGRS